MQLSLGRLAEFGYLKFEVKEGGTYVNAYRLLLEEANVGSPSSDQKANNGEPLDDQKANVGALLPVQSPKRRTSVTKKANRHSYMIPYLSLK
ncbi:hypothetical protein G6321_00043070 [Bradyrhizobium barranii subsp. barranii]|uniref:Uncharacterized protein n=1 Tax=Bradyrhizobium barranii subsp. barranii TaxID=2823807 RepID=A0A9X9YNB4_9BRAD|nr:hypothetical protein [Bradyrhizobium barranii]UGX92419.1 hypothetical protein G6321_00043070 [Bradyrhizobium barranii subsp. barranii]